MNGVLLLVVELPDGSPGTVRADATDIFATAPMTPTELVSWTAREPCAAGWSWRCTGGRVLVKGK